MAEACEEASPPFSSGPAQDRIQQPGCLDYKRMACRSKPRHSKWNLTVQIYQEVCEICAKRKSFVRLALPVKVLRN